MYISIDIFSKVSLATTDRKRFHSVFSFNPFDWKYLLLKVKLDMVIKIAEMCHLYEDKISSIYKTTEYLALFPFTHTHTCIYLEDEL